MADPISPPDVPIYAVWYVNLLGAEYGPFKTKAEAQKFYYNKYMKDPEFRSRVLSAPVCPSCED